LEDEAEGKGLDIAFEFCARFSESVHIRSRAA
jgi:hypothetical protein